MPVLKVVDDLYSTKLEVTVTADLASVDMEPTPTDEADLQVSHAHILKLKQERLFLRKAIPRAAAIFMTKVVTTKDFDKKIHTLKVIEHDICGVATKSTAKLCIATKRSHPEGSGFRNLVPPGALAMVFARTNLVCPFPLCLASELMPTTVKKHRRNESFPQASSGIQHSGSTCFPISTWWNSKPHHRKANRTQV